MISLIKYTSHTGFSKKYTPETICGIFPLIMLINRQEHITNFLSIYFFSYNILFVFDMIY